MGLEKQRVLAKKRCIDAGICVLPYGNAWWLVGQGVNQVVGELADLSLSNLLRFSVTPR